MAMLDTSARDFIRWIGASKGLSAHTLRAYEGDLAALTRFLGGRLDAGEISAESIGAFVENQRLNGLSDATVGRRVAAIRGYLRWLVATGELQVDPLRDAPIKVRKPRRLPRAVPTSELGQLVGSLQHSAGLAELQLPKGDPLPSPHKATTLLAVGLMISTGVRVGEAVTIRCDSLNLSSRSIRIYGKGARERTVYFPAGWLLSLLESYICTRGELRISHDFLLFSRNGLPMSTSALRGRLAAASSGAGLNRVVTPHMLRHSAATELLDSGVDIRYVQRLLGHASINTTEIYTHVSDAALRKVITNANILERYSSMDN
jgi:integrase/recombinase XerD